MRGKETGARKFSQQELDQNEREIRRILERGTPAEVQKLAEIERSPELAPQIKRLIEQCRIAVAAQAAANEQEGPFIVGEPQQLGMRYLGRDPKVITRTDLRRGK
jgi:hypothetical protein